MRESPTDALSYEAAIFCDEVPDAALEVAASKSSELAGNPYTLAFCSGLDSCPRHLD